MDFCNLSDCSNLNTKECSIEEYKNKTNKHCSDNSLVKESNEGSFSETHISAENKNKNISTIFVVNPNPIVLNKEELVSIPNSKFHENSKSHVCPFKNCGKEFKEKGNLKNHIRAHVS
jgi:hypothetical protein